MNPHLQTILTLIAENSSLSAVEQEAMARAAKEVGKSLAIAEFKLSRTEKEKRTVSVLLEETIDELQRKSLVLEQANHDLKKALNTVQSTQNQLVQKEKLASLGELTAGIAHEIQNPLNFVNNFSDVSVELVDELQEGPFQCLSESEKENADDILRDLRLNLQKIHLHGGRASSIVRSMLEHSRTETGEKRLTDLNALADEYLKIAYHGQRAKDIDFNCELVTELTPDLTPLVVGSQEIGRVLLNLFNNALYAVAQQARQSIESAYKPIVKVNSEQQDNKIVISVSDNGTGIPEGVKAKIFQPFFTTKPTGEGTGLGLSLSYDIITKGHGGALTVESSEGKGSTFRLSLPIDN